MSDPSHLGRRGTSWQRSLAVLAMSAAVLVLTASPAWADPAEPGNYRSVVNAVEPRPTGVRVEVVGGDAFLSVAVAPGHTVEVPGYFTEPYLRIDEFGKVWLNSRSPARYINQDRYGITQIPDTVDADAAPEWEMVADRGAFAWHDHRIHWMSRDDPPTITGDHADIIFPWKLTITIDGVETVVSGELIWFPPVNPTGPALIGLIGILPFLAWRPGRHHPVAAIVAGGGAVALLVAVAEFATTPGFDRGMPSGAVLPAMAVAAGVTAMWLGRPGVRTWGSILLGAIALGWWVIRTSATLTAPILPSPLPVDLERAAVAAAGWLAAAAVVLAVYEMIKASRQSPDLGAGRTGDING